jgi:Bucentaur or craniofacial development
MTDPRDVDSQAEDDYDEEADSDFDVENVNDDIVSASSDEEEEQPVTAPRSKKRRKVEAPPNTEIDLGDRDSGDEEIIGEHKKQQERLRQKQKRKGKGETLNVQSDDEEQGWRARTRAMREREKDEKKKSKLATTKGATIDVEKIWEEMNRPTETTPSGDRVMADINEGSSMQHIPSGSSTKEKVLPEDPAGKENPSEPGSEEMVTIQESYMFAGKLLSREVKVPKSSLNGPHVVSKESSHVLLVAMKDKIIRRPLRRISRFDPNGNNDAYKKSWTKNVKVKKVNVLTKTAGDWEDHVEATGDREELDEYAKSKEGYLGRQDFLQTVEQRKEEEARLARLKH